MLLFLSDHNSTSVFERYKALHFGRCLGPNHVKYSREGKRCRFIRYGTPGNEIQVFVVKSDLEEFKPKVLSLFRKCFSDNEAPYDRRLNFSTLP